MDLVDIIEEIEEEYDSDNSTQSFTKEFYQNMHLEVLQRGDKPRKSAAVD